MHQYFTGRAVILAFLVIILTGQAVAGDQIYVNQTGWWQEGENFTPSFWPIEHAILNVSTSGSTVTIVEPGDYPHAITFWSSVQDGITLDLNGSTLNGTAFGVPAILIEGKNDITIRGGTIYRYTNGIVTTGTYDNLRLENLTISRSSEPAIRMDGAATNVTIDRVTITQSGIYGIEKNAGTVRNLTVTNSLISQPAIGGPTLDAVRFEDMGSYSFRDIVIDNVTAVNMTDHGIRVQQVKADSGNVTILNSTVTGTGNHGFFIESRGTIRLENNTVADCGFTGSYGLFLAGIDNPEVTYLKNTVQGNKQGNYISGIEGNFNESRFQNLADDLNLAGSSHINTYNSTFDKTKGNVADTSLLNVFWFVDLTVLDEGFSPVEGAFVLVNNSAGSTVYSGTTDASGRVPRFALNEYTRNSTAEVFHTPFQFHAEKAGATNDTAINVDRTMIVPLILKQPLPAPVASFTANRTSGNTPLAVRFNDTSLNNPTEWNWSFGDGTWFNTTEFTSRNVTKVYNNPGTYTVRLTVSNEGGSDSTLTGTDITVTEPVPSFTVMTPNGGEHWIQSSLQTITWNYTYHPGSMVMIELLRGTTVDTVISSGTSVGTEGSGSFTWRIPYNQTLGSDYLIRISSTSNPSYTDSSEAPFTIGAGAPLTVVSPDGGEQWKQGSTQTLRWNYTGDPGPAVKIEVIKGGANRVIVPSTPIGSEGSGSFNFTFPFSAPLGSDYRVRVTSTSNATCTDTSDAPFRIVPPLSVVSPNGGEEWEQGTTQTISWDYIGNPGPSVKIEALRGDTVIAVISQDTPVGTGGVGSLNLKLPKNAPPGTEYRIRISSTSNPLYTDSSDARFKVIANASSSLTLVSPNGGETYLQGSTQIIQWDYTGDPGPAVKIEALRNETVLAVITPGTAVGFDGSGSYNLTFPYSTPVGSGYRIRITSTSNPAWTDTSEAPFTVSPAITVLSPDGGEEWEQGSMHPIIWTYSGNPGPAVKIEALRGDTILAVVTPGTPIDPGMFNLTFPANTPLGNDYRIRVTSTTYSACTDMSNGFFAISASGG